MKPHINNIHLHQYNILHNLIIFFIYLTIIHSFLATYIKPLSSFINTTNNKFIYITIIKNINFLSIYN